MPTYANGENGSSVRNKINAAITAVDALNTSNNLLMSAAERAKLGLIEAGATADMTAAEIKAAYESNPNTNAFTTAEKTKLSGLESSLFRGLHASLAALQTAFPTGIAGAYGYVDPGVGQDVQLYLWDDNDAAWKAGGGAGSAETPATVLSKLLANPDTNILTDANLAKLAGIQGGATQNSPDATLLDRANHTGFQPIASLTGINAGDNLLMTAAERAALAALVASGGDIPIRNTTGVTIGPGKAVYITGFDTGTSRYLVALSDADLVATIPCPGLTTAAIANGADGFLRTGRLVEGLDTSAFTQNAPLYVSNTAGDLTMVTPAVGWQQAVATVARVSAALGAVLVRPMEPGQSTGNLPAITDPAVRFTASVPAETPAGDGRYNPAAIADTFRTEMLVFPMCNTNVEAVAGTLVDVFWVCPPQFVGWQPIYVGVSAEAAGAAAGTTANLIRRRGAGEVNVLSAALDIGTGTYVATATDPDAVTINPAGITTANAVLALGDRLKPTVPAVNAGTKPSGLAMVVLLRKLA